MEISADLQEEVAHLRCVRDDALYKSTATLLYFTLTGIKSRQTDIMDGYSPQTLASVLQ